MTRNEITFICLLVINTVLISILFACIFQTDESKKIHSPEIVQHVERELYIGDYTAEVASGVRDTSTGLQYRHLIQGEIALKVSGDPALMMQMERTIKNFPAKVQGGCETVFRRAKKSDTEDPELAQIKSELKRHFQETLNTDSIDEVILGNFRIFTE